MADPGGGDAGSSQFARHSTEASASHAVDAGRRSSRSHGASSRRRRSFAESPAYDAPANYKNIDDVNTEPPVQNPDDTSPIRRYSSREERFSTGNSLALDHDDRSSRRRSSNAQRSHYEVPLDWSNLDEVAAGGPVNNYDESAVYTHHSLEETRGHDEEYRESRRQSLKAGEPPSTAAGADRSPSEKAKDGDDSPPVSQLATKVYTLSYLVFFSFMGTLARLGLTALTTYPGTPVIFSTIWANFGGSLVMGFLAEDRVLFSDGWESLSSSGNATPPNQTTRAGEEGGSASDLTVVDLAAAKKAHLATKKTIPLYIGLATGFCGSFTSFSSFIRDVFLALSNDLVTPGADNLPASRNGGYSFMALLAVIITTVSLALSGLFIGAHLAIAVQKALPPVSYAITRKYLDRLAVLLACGCWLGAILLSIFPPRDFWRGRATFALVFAPLGCLLRFYLALLLNGKVAAFPLGTFAANIFGTAVLGMAWDIAHVSIGGVVGCQVLQGIDDGFCGCLTTISTWVTELTSLRRWHAYVYGLASLLVALACMVAIMGGVRWADGFNALRCST
jgi:CrcB protein